MLTCWCAHFAHWRYCHRQPLSSLHCIDEIQRVDLGQMHYEGKRKIPSWVEQSNIYWQERCRGFGDVSQATKVWSVFRVFPWWSRIFPCLVIKHIKSEDFILTSPSHNTWHTNICRTELTYIPLTQNTSVCPKVEIPPWCKSLTNLCSGYLLPCNKLPHTGSSHSFCGAGIWEQLVHVVLAQGPSWGCCWATGQADICGGVDWTQWVISQARSCGIGSRLGLFTIHRTAHIRTFSRVRDKRVRETERDRHWERSHKLQSFL